jgi:hypothetical protein
VFYGLRFAPLRFMSGNVACFAIKASDVSFLFRFFDEAFLQKISAIRRREGNHYFV